ncbi:MAG TPA: hypothetical protein VGR76_22760 [Candidatus Angelobacter sp.]|nr:hypothetical protein [Candidatus Angelobacter sp.]
MAKQKELLTNILDHATQVSQQAEEAEPLLSKQLYDTVRKFSQDTAKDLKEAESELLNHGPMTRSLFELLRNNSEQSASKLEEITSEMLRLGYQQQAGRIGERAQPGIENLKKGIEHAAQSVIGDDTEALRMAERQLKDVSTQLQKEINRGLQAAGQTNSAAAGADGVRPGQNPQLGQANTNTSESMQSARASSEPGAQAGQNQQSAQAESGEQQGSGQGRQRGEPNGQQASAQGQQGDSSSEQGASAQAQSGQGDQPGAGQQGGEGQPNQTADASSPQNSGEQASAAGQNNGAGKPTRNRGAQQAGAANAGGGDPVETGIVGGARGLNWDRLLTQNAQAQNDPITGTDFTGWSDRLREVEELVDDSGMRDDVARARDRARVFRQDFKRERKKPDWAVLQLQVMKPLTEVHQKLVDELARRESQEALVPLDRDPVPNQYSDLVRRYYEELGKEK